MVIIIAGKSFRLETTEAGCMHMICNDCEAGIACTLLDSWEQAKHLATVHATAAIN